MTNIAKKLKYQESSKQAFLNDSNVESSFNYKKVNEMIRRIINLKSETKKNSKEKSSILNNIAIEFCKLESKKDIETNIEQLKLEITDFTKNRGSFSKVFRVANDASRDDKQAIVKGTKTFNEVYESLPKKDKLTQNDILLYNEIVACGLNKIQEQGFLTGKTIEDLNKVEQAKCYAVGEPIIKELNTIKKQESLMRQIELQFLELTDSNQKAILEILNGK